MAQIQQPPLPSSLPGSPHGPGTDGAAGTGTWAEPGTATQLSRRLCSHLQINVHEAEPQSQSQLRGTELPGAAGLARHGMARSRWSEPPGPRPPPAPSSSPHMMLPEATCAPAGRPGHRATRGKAGAVAGVAGASTECLPK